jgi:hypothetical protein
MSLWVRDDDGPKNSEALADSKECYVVFVGRDKTSSFTLEIVSKGTICMLV